ncbi:hypothetical protein Tco_1033762 [Tanacetum coccineum]
MENRLESRLVEKKRGICGMCSIIPTPRRRQFDDSRLRGKERMSTMLSSDATFSNGDVSFWTLFRRKCSSLALRMFIEQSHDKVYGCLKGGSGNSGGKILAISMVEEAWLSEKKERKNVSSKRKNVSSKRKNVFVEEKRMFVLKRKNVLPKRKDVLSKRKNVFVEEKECIVKEKECFRQREKDVFVKEKRRAF